MKTYEAVFDPNEVSGVYAISLVESPAMEGLFIALSKQEVQFKEVDKEQRILMGLVLEPNKPIYRNQNGEEFNIIFNEQTIKDLSYNFFKSSHQSNSTIEHDAKQKIEGVTFVESWIVENPENDKSNNFGFSYPKGSWIATMKVDSDEIWNNFVKNGKVQGFSIDAMLELKEVNFKSELNMSNQIVEAIEKGFALVFGKQQAQINFGSIMSADEQIKYEFDGEMLSVGANIFVKAEDGTQVPLPAGEYPLESGMTVIVAEEGIVAELVEAPMEEETPAEPAQMAQPQTNNISEEQAGAIANAVKSVLIKYSEEQDAKFELLKTELAETKEALVKLSAEPASKPIKATPMQMSAEPKNTKERLFNRLNQIRN